MNKKTYLTMEMDMRSGGKATNESGRIRSAAIWLGLLTVALGGLLVHSEAEKGPLRSRVYKLRHITSTAAKDILVRLKIGVDYNTLSSEVLIVTSDQSLDLLKATSVMTVADRETPAQIRPLMALGEGVARPKTEELAVRLRTLTLGTLTDGPAIGVPNPTIVDVFEGTLIGIGSPESLGLVETAIEAWKKEQAPKAEPTPAAAATAERQPSLEEVAAEIFMDPAKAKAVEPNAVEAVEEHSEQALTEEAVVSAEAAAMEKALLELQRQAEQAEAGDADAANEGLRAALEQLVRSAQEQEQPIQAQPGPTSIRKPDAVTQESKLEEVKKPSVTETRIVTGPTLPEGTGEKELELTVTLPEEVEIIKLLELVGKQLGLNYMYDKTIFQGQPGMVTLSIHDGKIKVSELYSLLESVLRFRGFVMTRRDRLVTIVRQQDIANVDPVLRLPDQEIQPGDVMVSSVFHLKHIAPSTAQTMLSQMRLGTGYSSIPETGTLIITDYAFRMERIREVIVMIDVAGSPKDFQYRQLRYMQAVDLVPKVKALSAQIKGVTVTVGGQAAVPAPAAAAAAARTTTRVDPQTGRPVVQVQTPAGAATPAAAAAAAAAQETVYLEADERTNRILMIGYAAEIETVNQLIDSLDVASYDLRFVREYVIQYVEATDVVTVLNELGLARVTVGTTRPSQQTATRQPARVSPQLTPQQLAQQQQQQQQQQMAQMQQTGGAGAGINEPYISLRAATNSLLVNATDEQHKAIELVISHVDVMQKDQRTIREYEIQYIDTQSVLDTLGDLGIITPRSTASSTGTTGRTTAQQQSAVSGMPAEGAVPMALPTAEGTEREITAQEPQIAILASTNSLLVHATPRQHSAIALVIAHADRQLDQISTPYVVYSLENQDAETLAEVLNKLIKETVDEASAVVARGATASASAPDARIQTRPTSSTATLPSGEELRIRVIPDKDSRSVIVYANRRNQQWMGELIRKLDEYRPQVLLDVTLVNITRDDEFKFDLELVSKSGGFPPGGTDMVNLTPIVSPFPAETVLEATSSYSNSAAFYSDRHVQAMLNLLDKKNYGRVLAKPSILVKDNQEGIIKAENVIYVAEPKSNVITGEGGQLSKTSDVTFKDYTAGLTLTITPHIAAENLLQLKIVLDRKDFAAGEDRTVTIDGNTYTYPKNTTSSNVDTWSILPDGATIILGGIESLNQGKTVNKVPILGDLPLIGLLFRGINEKDVQSRLYVFVKANIIRPGDELTGKSDIEQISQKKRQAFEEFEAKFQGLQALPGVKPNPIQPEKVLEDDEYIEALRRKLEAYDKPVTVEVR